MFTRFYQDLGLATAILGSAALFLFSGQMVFGQTPVNDLTAAQEDCGCEDPCGNGIVETGEQCDYGKDSLGRSLNGIECSPEYGGTCQYCTNTCQFASVAGSYCGDGEVNAGEECDVAKTPAICTDTCKRVRCGDGVVQGTESCDAGGDNGKVCMPGSTSCTYCGVKCEIRTVQGPSCGNNKIEIGETCDDGNTIGGDGCSETCIAEPKELLDTGAETIKFELPKPKPEPIFLPAQNIYLPAKLPDTGASL